MLAVLHIHNFALIEDAVLEFTGGFNVFTGETGAGKTILVDALSMVLGARASADFVRRGTNEFWVQGVFAIADFAPLQGVLAELDIENEDDYLYLKRKVTAEGRSSATVNGVNVPVSVLRRIASYLVDIHGQHEHQRLLQPEMAGVLLDDAGGAELEEALAAYRACYDRSRELKKELDGLRRDAADRGELLASLEDEIKEIEGVAPKTGEEEELRSKAQLLANNEKIMQGITAAHSILQGGESTGLLDLLTEAQEGLAKAASYDRRLAASAEELETIWFSLDEVRSELAHYLSNDEFDPALLDSMEQRLETLGRLKRKYGGSLETVLEHLAAAREKRDSLADLEAEIARVEKAYSEAYREMAGKASGLTAIRKQAAEKLSRQVTYHIKDLAMEQGRLVVQVSEDNEYTAKGHDRVEFLFSANAGIEPLPLAKVASGGELSRLALAFKTVLLSRQEVPTMIFDEIDTGVGGVVAQRMAEKIATIAQSHQVLCVTHLAQIASFADNHLHIAKRVSGDSTFTAVETLDRNGRIGEIMRMMGGDNVSAAARTNAEELLTRAEEIKSTL